MPGLRELLGIFLPALLCGLLLAVERRGAVRVRGGAYGLVFAGGWFLGYFLISGGLPAWPSADRSPPAKDWLAWIVALSGVLSLVYFALPNSRVLAAAARPILAAAVAFLPLRTWAVRNETFGALAFAALGIVVAWVLADLWVARASGPRAPLALFAAAVGASVACLFAHSAILAMLIGSLASLLAACAVLGILVPKLRLPTSATAVVAIVLLGTAVIARVTSQMPLASAILIGVSLVLPGLATLGAAQASSRWKRAFLGVALAFAPAALAAWLAWSPDASEY